MPADIQRIVVVLHGPPAVGKTQISEEIRRRYRAGFAEHISLDDGWMPGEVRHSGGPGRYADLRNAQTPILIVEIACGEPPDLAFAGATRAAQEWLDALRNSGRAVFPFLLWLEWPDAFDRLMKRWRGHRMLLQLVANQLGLYSLYERRDSIVTFPTMPGFQEERINTSGRTIAEVADEIVRRCGL